jgi:Recombination endonuclease VII
MDELTELEYHHLLKYQGGGCAICGEADGAGPRRLVVDHDPTGLVRGLLCSDCRQLARTMTRGGEE